MRLIDADALIKKFQSDKEYFDKVGDTTFAMATIGVINDIDKAPTIDAVSVVHGEWIEAEEDWRQQIAFWRCSECGHTTSTMYNFCPNCGAKMDGERKTDD